MEHGQEHGQGLGGRDDKAKKIRRRRGEDKQRWRQCGPVALLLGRLTFLRVCCFCCLRDQVLLLNHGEGGAKRKGKFLNGGNTFGVI